MDDLAKSLKTGAEETISTYNEEREALKKKLLGAADKLSLAACGNEGLRFFEHYEELRTLTSQFNKAVKEWNDYVGRVWGDLETWVEGGGDGPDESTPQHLYAWLRNFVGDWSGELDECGADFGTLHSSDFDDVESLSENVLENDWATELPEPPQPEILMSNEIQELVKLACEADTVTETDSQNLNAPQMGDAFNAFARVSLTHPMAFDRAWQRARQLASEQLEKEGGASQGG